MFCRRAMRLFDQKLKLPTVHQWNLTVEHELPGGVVAQASYIGRRGLRLLRAYDVNQIKADPILPSFLIMQQNMIAPVVFKDASAFAIPAPGTNGAGRDIFEA